MTEIIYIKKQTNILKVLFINFLLRMAKMLPAVEPNSAYCPKISFTTKLTGIVNLWQFC